MTRGVPQAGGVGQGANNYSPYELDILRNISQSLARSVMIPYNDVNNGKCTSDVAHGT
jgi:hypothetical protein